jgi:hypothetical protein
MQNTIYDTLDAFLADNPETTKRRRTRVACIMDKVIGNAGHPNRLITFDCETRPSTCSGWEGDPSECPSCQRVSLLAHEDEDEIQDLIFACATFTDFKRDQLDKAFFTDADEFWDWVDEHTVTKMVTWVVNHNINFDLMVMAFNTALTSRGWVARSLILPDPSGPTMMEWTCNKRVLKMANLANWWGMRSLKSIGQVIGEFKGDVDPSLPKYRHARPSDPAYDEFVEYCHQDAYIVREAVRVWMEFCRTNDLGTFAMTQAGQALTAYRHRFMDHDIYLHCDYAVMALERAAYKGARTECFRRGDYTAPSNRPFRYVDVNSLYPSVMRDNVYPVKLTGRLTYDPGQDGLSDLKELLLEPDVCIIARVTLSIDSEAQRIIAHRYGGRLVYPVGIFDETLTTRELGEAMVRGCITYVHEIVTYDAAHIFTNYVDHFYRMRQQFKAAGNKVFTEIVKLFLNSLYGKFGQHVREWVRCELDGLAEGITTVMDATTGEMTTYRHLGGIVERRIDVFTESRYSFAAIAAHVIADARMIITSMYETAGIDECLYCDTDSLFVTDKGYQQLVKAGVIDDTRLGAMKVEMTSPTIRITTLKDYQFGDHTKRKGMRRDAQPQTPTVYRQTQFRGLSGALRAQDPDHARVGYTVKTFTGAYTKGTTDANGKVHPIRL